MLQDGLLFTWGYNGAGRLGHGDTKARMLPTFVESVKHTHITSVACGKEYTCAVDSTGIMYVITTLPYMFILMRVCDEGMDVAITAMES